MARDKITVVITGGTIDSEWDPVNDTASVAEETSLPSYFNRIKPESVELDFNTVCMKDSRALTPDDLKKMSEAIESSDSDMILVTHGTYTMPDTARYLQAHLKSDKKVVLTGSMIPLRGYDMSDAGFNLGFAIATLLNMKPGILLAMHAQTFEPDEVAKNMNEARFFSVKQ